jgi:EAL domain-containing protein (putative c-di-GMP-specific phosphodiesterase class I)
LVRLAEQAMFEGKRLRQRQMLYSPSSEAARRSHLNLLFELQEAIAGGQLRQFLQPKVSLQDGSLAGAEALVRWLHPQRGLIGPDEFIPVAEARRLILPIGQWVLQEALRCAVRWHASGLARVPVAVNLSSLQFQAPGFVESVERALAEAGAGGGMLELELTERMLMDDVDLVRAALVRLQAFGVGIAVDDFGTGYTSLAHLKQLPINRLKIDRSFVTDLPHDTGSAAIARAIIQMGKSLGLQVVAEGVETEAQRDWVRAQGCDAQQGFFDGEPMGLVAFEAWLAGR